VPTNRTPIDRTHRPALIPQAILLFVELERTPVRQRGEAFREREHELARMLGLVAEYWSMNSVLDRSRRPCWPEGYAARDHWKRCRRVRQPLLALTRPQ
jgi:hypothetical protein